MFNIILTTIAVMILIESLIILIFNKPVKTALKKATKKDILKKFGFIELIAGIIILIASIIIS